MTTARVRVTRARPAEEQERERICKEDSAVHPWVMSTPLSDASRPGTIQYGRTPRRAW
jgi:hypothetical protein